MTTPTAHDVFRPVDDVLASKEFWAEFEVAVAREVTPLFFEIFHAGYLAANDVRPITQKAIPELVPAPLDIAAIEALAEQAILGYVPEFSKSFTDTTYDAVRRAVLDARANGTGIEGVLQKIEPMFGPKRAELVGVTETTRLFGMGAQANYRAQGINGWQWQTVNDPWVEAQCQGLQDEVFPIDKLFAPEHPRCRCFPVPVLIDEESKPQQSTSRSRLSRLLRLPRRREAIPEQPAP